MADLTIAETAAVLGVSSETVRRRIRRGALSARPYGRRYIVSLSAELVHPWLDLDQTRQLLDEVRRCRDALDTEVRELSHERAGVSAEFRELCQLLDALREQLPALGRVASVVPRLVEDLRPSDLDRVRFAMDRARRSRWQFWRLRDPYPARQPSP